jgi:hypothetical protein
MARSVMHQQLRYLALLGHGLAHLPGDTDNGPINSLDLATSCSRTSPSTPMPPATTSIKTPIYKRHAPIHEWPTSISSRAKTEHFQILRDAYTFVALKVRGNFIYIYIL